MWDIIVIAGVEKQMCPFLVLVNRKNIASKSLEERFLFSVFSLFGASDLADRLGHVELDRSRRPYLGALGPTIRLLDKSVTNEWVRGVGSLYCVSSP